MLSERYSSATLLRPSLGLLSSLTIYIRILKQEFASEREQKQVLLLQEDCTPGIQEVKAELL